MDVKQKQRTVIEFLLLEGRAGEEITIRLYDVYGEDAYSRVTVFRWINRIRSSDGELESEKPPSRPPRYETDRQIQEIIRDHPFPSLRMIAEMLGISPETVRLLLLRIGYVLKALHWIPHTLTEDLK
jgi:transposase